VDTKATREAVLRFTEAETAVIVEGFAFGVAPARLSVCLGIKGAAHSLVVVAFEEPAAANGQQNQTETSLHRSSALEQHVASPSEACSCNSSCGATASFVASQASLASLASQSGSPRPRSYLTFD
jgi:hypothetical protein